MFGDVWQDLLRNRQANERDCGFVDVFLGSNLFVVSWPFHLH